MTVRLALGDESRYDQPEVFRLRGRMDIYGFVLAFERARNAPTMNGHRILFRRLRELLETKNLVGFKALVDEINQRMPGAPLSDLAHVWATWHRREDDLDELFRNPDWRKAREEDNFDSQKIAESASIVEYFLISDSNSLIGFSTA